MARRVLLSTTPTGTNQRHRQRKCHQQHQSPPLAPPTTTQHIPTHQRHQRQRIRRHVIVIVAIIVITAVVSASTNRTAVAPISTTIISIIKIGKWFASIISWCIISILACSINLFVRLVLPRVVRRSIVLDTWPVVLWIAPITQWTAIMAMSESSRGGDHRSNCLTIALHQRQHRIESY